MKHEGPQLISRRALLRRGGAAAAAGAAVAAGVPAAAETPAETAATTPAATTPGASQAPAPEPPRAAWEHLTAEEADLLEAIADQLIPSDDLGPGAVAAGAVVYIDRALGGALSESRDAYRAGLAAFDRYCRASRGAPFRELPHVDRVSTLIDVETGAATGARTGFAGSSAAFFNMVRGHVLQGTFGDPWYGGNRDYVGWDLIDYPGVRTAVWPRLQAQLEAGELPSRRRSAYDTEYFDRAVVDAATGEKRHGD
jgi:gluconate 2-dehydrogenase gamma chain